MGRGDAMTAVVLYSSIPSVGHHGAARLELEAVPPVGLELFGGPWSGGRTHPDLHR
jgi:hypothetical protein